MYVARSLCTLKSHSKVKGTFWGVKLSIDGDEFKPQSDWYQPLVTIFNASTWVRVCGRNSDKAFRLTTGVWRRQEIKTSGARLNKKSVRKRRLTSNAKFSLKNWKWQVLRKYEMPKECWHATIQKHWNKSVSLNPSGVSKSSKNGVFFYKSSYLRFEFFISMQNWVFYKKR